MFKRVKVLENVVALILIYLNTALFRILILKAFVYLINVLEF